VDCIIYGLILEILFNSLFLYISFFVFMVSHNVYYIINLSTFKYRRGVRSPTAIRGFLALRRLTK
jgi:hypothetical protein